MKKDRILVVNVNWVGDVIFSTPIFKAFKKNHPGAYIACLAVPRVREILESCSYIDEVIVYDEKGKHRSFFKKIKIVYELWRRHFSVAFILHRSYTRAVLVWLAGIPRRVGYDTKKRGWLLTHKVEPLTPLIDDVHRSDYYLNVIESYGERIDDRSCELMVLDQARTEVERLLLKQEISQADRLVVVNAGGNWDLKRWPKEQWAALVNRLTNELKVKVVIPGAPKDVHLAEDIAELSGVTPVVLAGQTDLKQLMAVMQRANLVISADSGPMHIANCVGTPVIGVFGPTRPEITGPRGKGKFVIIQKESECNRTPCYNLDCPDNTCMRAITVDDVLAAIASLGIFS